MFLFGFTGKKIGNYMYDKIKLIWICKIYIVYTKIAKIENIYKIIKNHNEFVYADEIGRDLAQSLAS